MDPWHTPDSYRGPQLTPGEIWGQRKMETLRGTQGQKEQVTRTEKQREGRPSQMQPPRPIPLAPPPQALEPWWGGGLVGCRESLGLKWCLSLWFVFSEKEITLHPIKSN